MKTLKKTEMIWKIMWWRRFDDLRKINIENKMTKQILKTLKLSEYIDKNIEIFKSVKDDDNLIKSDVNEFKERLNFIISNYKTNL